MKILIKAPPRAGKSTLIQNFKNQYNKPKLGFIVTRMFDKNNENQGFLVSTIDGRSKILAHKELVQSEIIVGNGYKVDLDVLENFVSPELGKSIDKHELVIFDEIGRMQSYSERFLNATRALFNSKTDFLATIVYDDEPWSMEFKMHPEVIVIELTIANRDFLLEILLVAFENAEYYNNLNPKQKEFIKTELLSFLDKNMFIQAKKLFKNTVLYIGDKRIKKVAEDDQHASFETDGITNKHVTTLNKENNMWTCDCDLFNGRNQFEGKAGICSHIETVKLYLL